MCRAFESGASTHVQLLCREQGCPRAGLYPAAIPGLGQGRAWSLLPTADPPRGQSHGWGTGASAGSAVGRLHWDGTAPRETGAPEGAGTGQWGVIEEKALKRDLCAGLSQATHKVHHHGVMQLVIWVFFPN